MNISPIKSEQAYKKALKRLEQIFDAYPNTTEGDELEILSIIIEEYENKKYPIDLPDPIEAIKFRMEQLGLQQNDFINVIGLKNKPNEIMNKKRKLTLEMIRQINESLSIPADVLIQRY